MLSVYRMSAENNTISSLRYPHMFSPYCVSITNGSFLANKKQACFNYPVVTDRQSV